MTRPERNDRIFGRKGNPVKMSRLHASCPNCYSDCSPPVAETPDTIVFGCLHCGEGFSRDPKEARTHTTWLLTRGSLRVQAAIATEGVA